MASLQIVSGPGADHPNAWFEVPAEGLRISPGAGEPAHGRILWHEGNWHVQASPQGAGLWVNGEQVPAAKIRQLLVDEQSADLPAQLS